MNISKRTRDNYKMLSSIDDVLKDARIQPCMSLAITPAHSSRRYRSLSHANIWQAGQNLQTSEQSLERNRNRKQSQTASLTDMLDEILKDFA